jgi:hypothetical protein
LIRFDEALIVIEETEKILTNNILQNTKNNSINNENEKSNNINNKNYNKIQENFIAEYGFNEAFSQHFFSYFPLPNIYTENFNNKNFKQSVLWNKYFSEKSSSLKTGDKKNNEEILLDADVEKKNENLFAISDADVCNELWFEKLKKCKDHIVFLKLKFGI